MNDVSAPSSALVWATRLVLVAGGLGAWEYFASTGRIDVFFWGRPSMVAAQLVTWAQTTLLSDLIVTLEEAFIGLVIGTVGGIALGIFLGLSSFWRKTLQPFIDFANSTPRIALAPLFLLWFGLGIASKVGVVTSIVFFIMLINTQEGVISINPDFFRLIRILGADRFTSIWYVVLPACIAWIKAGLRLSIPYAIAGAVVAEFVAANKGLGYRLVQQASGLNASGTLAVVFVLAVLGSLFSAMSNRLLAEPRRRPTVDLQGRTEQSATQLVDAPNNRKGAA
jgi:NitT/TauT family transport system permease protein